MLRPAIQYIQAANTNGCLAAPHTDAWLRPVGRIQVGRRWLVQICLLLPFLLIAAGLAVPSAAFAQGETSADLVYAVNALRASQNLAPYQVDSWLMAYAQEHAEYQAARHSGTHIHSDGSYAQDLGLHENVASGDQRVINVSVVVNQIWVDWGHRHVMVDYPYGEIGAGIAAGDDGQVYYTVDIRPGNQAATDLPAQPTPVPFTPYLTSTPNKDGMIIHVVAEGQALWSIAQSYGVTVDEIRQLNVMPPDSVDIYPGQELLIRIGVTGTPGLPDQTPVETAQPGEETAIPFTATLPPTGTTAPSPSSPQPPSPSISETPASAAPATPLRIETILGWVILGLGILGLFLVILYGFRRSPR